MKLELIVLKKQIMEILDYSLSPKPYLMMPYFPIGNLEGQHGETPFSRKETNEILYQVLRALTFLHSRKIAHRDLKPANILVESCLDPSISISLADFGLSKLAEDDIFKTRCGSAFYTAPEMSIPKVYHLSVGLWSTGVMILEYAYGLPKLPVNMREWYQHIIFDHANDRARRSDPLINLVIVGMLQIDPTKRLLADECLRKLETISCKDHI